MGVKLLRDDGWEVVFLGASVPGQDLQSFAARTDPDVVVLSCTVPLFLPGAARAIAAVAELGLPVVAAGAGFGVTGAGADRLGSSAWIGPGSNPTEVLRGARSAAGPPHERHPEAIQLELDGDELISGCIAEMFVRIPQMSSYSERHLASTRTDLGHILRYLRQAVDLDESDLFDRFVSWRAMVLGPGACHPRCWRPRRDRGIQHRTGRAAPGLSDLLLLPPAPPPHLSSKPSCLSLITLSRSIARWMTPTINGPSASR